MVQIPNEKGKCKPCAMASFYHALVSLLPANATFTPKAMAVRHNLVQHKQLYVASF